MLRKALRLAAYVKAPVKTFMLMHPIRALKWGAAYLIVKTALDVQRRPEERERTRPRARKPSPIITVR